MSNNMKIPIMTALFLTSLAIAYLSISAQARTLPPESWHRKIAMIVVFRTFSPATPPKSAPPTKQITNTVNHLKKFPPPYKLATNFERTRRTPSPSPKLIPPESQLQTSDSPCVTEKARQLAPPAPSAPSKSPTQSENITFSCAAGNPCSSLITTVVVEHVKRETLAPPPPAPSNSPTQAEYVASPCAADNPCSGLTTTVADYGREKTLPPPPPTPSKSPTQSEKNDSPCLASNPCSTSPLIKMKSDHGEAKLLPPPTPASSKSPIREYWLSLC